MSICDKLVQQTLAFSISKLVYHVTSKNGFVELYTKPDNIAKFHQPWFKLRELMVAGFLSNHLRTSKAVSLVSVRVCNNVAHRRRQWVGEFWTKEGRTNLRNLKWSEERELCVRINRLRSLNELIAEQKIKVKCFINFTRAYSQHEVWRLMEGRSSFFLLRSRAWASLLSCTYRFIHSR